jgi:hypothetical protein
MKFFQAHFEDQGVSQNVSFIHAPDMTDSPKELH